MKVHPKVHVVHHSTEQPASNRQKINGTEPNAEYLYGVDIFVWTH